MTCVIYELYPSSAIIHIFEKPIKREREPIVYSANREKFGMVGSLSTNMNVLRSFNWFESKDIGKVCKVFRQRDDMKNL